jgi:signal transduction histidine kinase
MSATTALAMQQQYTELAELAGGFIHEIKNHLNTLSLNVQLLAEDFEEPETPRERKAVFRINKISDQCQRLVELSNDFLRFARISELRRSPIDLPNVVTRMVEYVGPKAQSVGVTIHWFPPADLPQVALDVELFEKVLLNLLLNAYDAMPQGGSLTIQALATESWVVLDVIDTGCGMTHEQLALAFKPFVTSKPAGNGLGLATAKKIVTAHQGTIEVQSELGRGTKFSIRLPAIRNF